MQLRSAHGHIIYHLFHFILFKFKFNRFLNLYNPHVATLIEAGCITYNKIHYITNALHHNKIQKNTSLLKSGKEIYKINRYTHIFTNS